MPRVIGDVIRRARTIKRRVDIIREALRTDQTAAECEWALGVQRTRIGELQDMLELPELDPLIRQHERWLEMARTASQLVERLRPDQVERIEAARTDVAVNAPADMHLLTHMVMMLSLVERQEVERTLVETLRVLRQAAEPMRPCGSDLRLVQ